MGRRTLRRRGADHRDRPRGRGPYPDLLREGLRTMAAGETRMTEPTQSQGSHETEDGGESREFLKYTFYRVRPEWRLLDSERKKKQKAEFASLLHDFEEDVTLWCYSLQGIRADVDFMVWAIDPHLETFREMARRVSSTELGHYLETTYAYLAASKRSQYVGGHTHKGQDGLALTFVGVAAHVL